MKYLIIFIIIWLSIQAKRYQLIQNTYHQTGKKYDQDGKYEKYLCKISSQKILHLYQPTKSNLRYQMISYHLYDPSNITSSTIMKDDNSFLTIYLSSIQQINYVIFLFNTKICVEQLSEIQNRNYKKYQICNNNNTFLDTQKQKQNLNILSNYEQFIKINTMQKQIQGLKSYLKQYRINKSGYIKESEEKYELEKTSDYTTRQTFHFKNLTCIFLTKTFMISFECYHFEQNKEHNKTYDLINVPLDNDQQYNHILVLDQYLLIWSRNKISKNVPIYNISIAYDENSANASKKQINGFQQSGDMNIMALNQDTFFMFTSYTNGTFIKIYSIIHNQAKVFQIIPYQFIKENFQISNLCNDDKNIIILNIMENSNNLDAFTKIQQKQSINYISYYLTAIIVGISIITIIFALIKYPIEIIYYLNQIKFHGICQIISLSFIYATFFIIMSTLDLNYNKKFRPNLENVTVLDSSITRIFYYLYFMCALINCFFIIFAQKNLKNLFNHLLTKHSFNVKAFVIIKISLIIIKITILSMVNMIFLYHVESIFTDNFGHIMEDIFTMDSKMVSLFIVGATFMVILSFITLIVLELSSSYWHSIEIVLVLFFTLSFINEYFHQQNQIFKLEFTFIILSPFTIFSTIIESKFFIKLKYINFIRNSSQILLFVTITIQFVAVAILYFALSFGKIKKYDIYQLVGDNNNTFQMSMLTATKQYQSQNQSSNRQSQGQNQSTQNVLMPEQSKEKDNFPLLKVFIPCKISTYKGFEKKKILQNIKFQGYRHELISFIDYTNQSKSALMKILINDEKSDTYLEQDLKGEIFYSRNFKISFCSDKNILSDHLNAIDHLKLFLSLKKKGISKVNLKKQVDYMLDQFNITDQQKIKQVKQLSGGTKRKVCLACAFIGDPDIVILNEPTIGLDMRFKNIFLQLLKKWKQNKLIILGTSNTEEIEMISDKIFILNNGKMSQYSTEVSKKYFELIFDFFQEEHFQFCKGVVDQQFYDNCIFKKTIQSTGLYRLKLDIYEIKKNSILFKIQKIIKIISQKYDKSFYFYFKTHQKKFTVQQFYKYRNIINQKLQKIQQDEIIEMQDIICDQLSKHLHLQSSYNIKDSQSYYDKQSRIILNDLSKIAKDSDKYFGKLKPIIYFKFCYIKNQKLFLREIVFVSLFFWASVITNQAYDYQVQYRHHFYVRILLVYSYLMVSVRYNSSIDQSNLELLTTIGSDFRYIWLSQFLFNTCYISSSFFINLTIYFLYELIFETVQENVFIIYLGSLLYILNFTLLDITLLITLKRKQLTLIIFFIIIICPSYIYNDIFMINYPTFMLILKQALSFILFPVSLSSLYQNIFIGEKKYYYLTVLLYQLAIPISILQIYKKVVSSRRKKKQVMNLEQIHNVANDSIIQEQRIVQDLFDDKEIIYGFNVCKKYKNQTKYEPSLRNIYFHCKKGEILTFVGHNGCGKTTLFNIIANKLKTTRGQISVLGKQQEQMTSEDYLNTAYCSQEGQLFLKFTVQQNIRFIGLIKCLTQTYLTKFTIKMLKYFKLNNKQKAIIEQLTQGERKKVSIIISLLGFPSMIIYDQPTSSIDSQSRDNVFYMIKNYSKMFKPMILITTHNINQANEYSSNLIILKKGILLKMGAPQQLIKHPSQQLYKVIMSFKLNETELVRAKKKKMVKEYMRELIYINIMQEQGIRFIYGLDLFKINICRVFQKLIKWFKADIICKFSLYKYDLQEVVRYNMAVDQSHEEINEKKLIKKKHLNI